MVSGVSRMDSEWWKTPRFIYGKVLGSFGKFRVTPRKVRNILEWGGTGPAGPAHPGEPHQGWPAWPSRVGEGVPPSLHASGIGRGVPPPHSFRCVLFPFLFGKLEFELVWTRDLVGLRNLQTHESRAFIYETPRAAKNTQSTSSPGLPLFRPTQAAAAAACHRRLDAPPLASLALLLTSCPVPPWRGLPLE